MYLEERVEQLEHLTADQGRQIETIAKGLADLTTDVRAIRQDMTAGFARIDARFEKIDGEISEIRSEIAEIKGEIAEIRSEFAQIKIEFAEIKVEFKRVNDRLDEMQQTQQLILKVLTDRL